MTKPTNEERREVAARLRVLSSHREVDKELVEDALGLYMGECIDGYDPVSVMELADLIEPEPERTCRMEYDPVHCDYVCTACGEWHNTGMYDACDADDMVLLRPYRYCPKCGARVEVER